MSSEFPTRSNSNGAVQPETKVRGLKFQTYEVKGLYHLFSETNALVSCAVLRS